VCCPLNWHKTPKARLDHRLPPLANAIAQLGKSLAYAYSPAALADAGLREQFRNSVIQCFEFAYKLSWKILKRYLETTEPSAADLDLGTFQNLIRLGNERSLLRSDGSLWKTYRQARTDSSYTYDTAKTETVFSGCGPLPHRARHTAKPYSDLDLAVLSDLPMSLAQMADIQTAFEESDLPIRVDVVDWASCSETFRAIIAHDKIVVQPLPSN
jgi:nucleotidyltransferase substrate binding protein (TIGR01987 family)